MRIQKDQLEEIVMLVGRHHNLRKYSVKSELPLYNFQLNDYGVKRESLYSTVQNIHSRLVADTAQAAWPYSVLACRENGSELARSNDKSPYTHSKIQKATCQHTIALKKSITKRLRTYLGRSTVTHWCLLTNLRALNLTTHRKSSVINRIWPI